MKKNRTIAFIMNAFPVLSETFVSREVVGLRRRGLDIEVFSIFPARIDEGDREAALLRESTHYLGKYARPFQLLIAHFYFIAVHPVRYFSAFLFSLRNRENKGIPFKAVMVKGRKNIPRSVRQDLLLHFVLAVPLARMVHPTKPVILNAHFADAAASLTLLVSRLLKVPFGMTMHAYDIFSHQHNMKQKLSEAQFIFTCTLYNKSYLIENFPRVDAGKVHVFYHGIDVHKYKPVAGLKSTKPLILSVGRLVPKKGFYDLLEACSILANRGVHFECKIIGDGPLRHELQNRIKALELTASVRLLGAVSHSKVIDSYNMATLFVLPSVVDESGDRDGIPNVIAEAMAMGLPVVATDVSAIPELVKEGETGFLVQQKNPAELADALQQILEQPQLSMSLGKAARKKVASVFDADLWLDKLAAEYQNIINRPG